MSVEDRLSAVVDQCKEVVKLASILLTCAGVLILFTLFSFGIKGLGGLVIAFGFFIMGMAAGFLILSIYVRGLTEDGVTDKKLVDEG